MKKLFLLLAMSAVVLAGCCASDNYVKKEKPKKSKMLKTEKTAEGTKITLKGDVSFDTMSAELSADAKEELTDLGKKLSKDDVKYVKIVGHTDSRGRDAYNMALSRDRAESVRQVLKKAGMKSSRMEAVGMGPRQPVADNKTENGRAKNRRVEIFVKE